MSSYQSNNNWSVFKYVVNNVNQAEAVTPNSVEQAPEHTTPNDPIQEIKEHIGKYTKYYLIALHYLDVPIVLTYSSSIVPECPCLVRLREYFEPVKEATRILMQNKAELVSGFFFLRHGVKVRKAILESTDLRTFDLRSANSGLESYVINDLRTIWKNSRFQYLKDSLPKQYEQLYLPNKDHAIYRNFVDFLKNTYARGIDRFKAYICIGSSFIGKSVFFMKFIVPERYYIYHSNNLEYSKMPDQPHKIFRILDDINWGMVTDMEFKALLNRNISSVDVKYGYEYLFPLIPIIIMNKEDYNTFRNHFSAIWEFIERNTVIYPPQLSGEAAQEETPLFTGRVANEEYEYLFDEIVPIKEIDDAIKNPSVEMKNVNEWIKKYLDRTQGYFYDNHKYLQLPNDHITKIPNPSIAKRTIMEQYDEYLLKKRKKEMQESEMNEKKPKLPMREFMNKIGYREQANDGYDDEETAETRSYNLRNKTIPARTRTYTSRYRTQNRFKTTRRKQSDYDNEYNDNFNDYNNGYNDYNNKYNDEDKDERDNEDLKKMDDDFSDMDDGDSDNFDESGDFDGSGAGSFEDDGGFIEL